MGNVEGCLRAAGLAAAEQHKSGDILPPIGSSSNRIDANTLAPAGSVVEVDPEDLPQPIALEDALTEPMPEETEPAPEEGKPAPEPEASEEAAPISELDGVSDPAVEQFEILGRASQNIIDQANAEFDRIDTNGDGIITREEFAATEEEHAEQSESAESTTTEQQIPEYRREWTLNQASEEADDVPVAATEADDEPVPELNKANEAMHAWREGEDTEEPDEVHVEEVVVDSEEPVDGLHKFLDAVKAGFGSQYTSALKKGGFETGRALSLAGAKDLQQCGVALGHALLIVDTVQKVAKYC